MTLRTIESEFSEELLKQVKDEFPLDLTLDGPIMSQLHPKIIWSKLQFQHNPQQEAPQISIPGWHTAYFANLQDAQAAYPEIKLVFEGKLWMFAKFLQDQHQLAIIDFPPLGTVVLSKNELPLSNSPGLHQHLLPHWIAYALSPELWGAQGKWTRFHSRLHQILKDHNLLNGEDTVGYYPLIDKARSLERYGFQGTNFEKSYLLVLPWTFSLAALEKLEEIIRQEF
ncbi:MAG: hypothetical protein NDI69_16390 [Bacteriovoracaceae bacterium]|nr:hypothetical protein [Bacteriovoracaceae bacterium]